MEHLAACVADELRPGLESEAGALGAELGHLESEHSVERDVLLESGDDLEEICLVVDVEGLRHCRDGR